jgi:long-chain acyl-CoA synthetase
MILSEIESSPVLRDLLKNACQKHAQKNALLCQGSSLSYEQVRDRSLRLASYLQNKCHIRKGDRVALFLPNTMQFIISCLAALEIGAVVVNINPLYTERELEHVLKDSTPKAIIFLENFHLSLSKVSPQYLPKFIICTTLGDCYSWWKKYTIWIFLHLISRAIPPINPSFSQRISWWSQCQNEPVSNLSDIDITPKDLAFLQYTGGTTGTPKGAMLSHGNLASNITQAAQWILKYYPETEKFRIATALPLYHIFSLTANFLTFFVLGSENLLIINPRDFSNFIKDWKRYPVDAICGVNTLFAALMKQEKFHSLDKSRLKIVLGGGMAVSPSLAQQWQERTGTTIIQAYGLTESSPAVSINSLNLKHFSKSIGYALKDTEVMFMTEHNTPATQGDLGELWVRGPQVMQGYWNNPKETLQVLTQDGWLKTGDIGYQDKDNLIYLVDRKKDLIIISGFNVYPSEIEELLVRHPDIEEAAVIGQIDEEGKENVVAFCVIKSNHNHPTPEELSVYCHSVLTGYKVPKNFYIIPQLPKSIVGKILKKDLKILLESME